MNMNNKQSKQNPPSQTGRPVNVLFLTVVLLLMTVFAPKANAADTYDLNLSKATFEQVVKEIESISDYTFVYKVSDVATKTDINIKAKKQSINRILAQLVAGTPLKYEIRGKRIFVYHKDHRPNFQEYETPASRAKVIIIGRVSDEQGEPLIGASVTVDGTKAFAVTDIDGNYSIEVPSEKYNDGTLSVSYVGFTNQKKRIGGNSNVDFQMALNAEVLDDVVVVGYGTQKRESLTSAISTLDSENLSRSSAVNTSGALVGKIAGINSRQSDGRPGAITTLNVRNMGTPLYVVDGVQMDEGQFNNIDFNDIESMSVLKDASASIYGVRAANGVVVVKTKSGKRNMQNEVNVNMYYGWQDMFRYSRTADAATWAAALTQSNTLLGVKNEEFTAATVEKWRQGTEPGYETFDWVDFTFQKAPQYYLSANTQGGSDKINYYFAVSHMNQESVIKNFGAFKRTNIQFNVNANITDNFKLGASINGRLEDNSHAAVAGNDGNDDYWTAFFAQYVVDPRKRPYANDNPEYPQKVSNVRYVNTALFGKTGEVKDKWRVIQANFNAEWEVFKNFTIKGLASYYYAQRHYDNQEGTYNLYTYSPASDSYSPTIQWNSHYKFKQVQYNEDINLQLSANYDNTFGDHKVSAFIGTEAYKHNSPGMQVGSNPQSYSLKYFYFDDLFGISEWGNQTQSRAGFMGRINYEYQSKYLFEFSARYDGSWKFPPKHRWGFFPSVSGGWRISEEAFWNEKLKHYVSNLKLRVSYGVMGDDNVWGYSPYDFLEGYNYGSGGAVLDGKWNIGSTVRSLPVTNITWMHSNIVDVGIDFGLLDNKLTGSLDYFRRMRTNIPAQRYDKVLPNEIGFSLPNENLNSDMTTGFDGNLLWQSRVSDFTYRVGFNFTFARRYNWHQYKPRFGNSREYYVYSANERLIHGEFVYKCIGQFQSWEEIANYPVDVDGKGNSTLRPGDLIYEDLNGDGVITGEDQGAFTYQGYESGDTPIFNYGINLGFEWKGIDFAADFAGGAGQSFWMNYEQRVPFWQENSPQWMLEDQWMLSDLDDANSELIPGKYPTAIKGNQGHSNYYASTFWGKNVKYLKLRNLEIGYTFPTKWLKKAKIRKLRVYTLMQNLFSIDNIHQFGLDPEIRQVAGFVSPTNRIFNFGVNVTF